MIYYGRELYSLDTYFQMKELSAAPATPQANELRLYAKDSGGAARLFYKSDNGTEYGPLDTSAITGTGTANRLAYWSSASVLAANAALTQGRVMFPDSNGLPTGSANLFWDNSNSRLGHGTEIPSFPFHGVIQGGYNFTLDTFGTATAPNYRGRGARNTIASPQAVQSGDFLVSLSGLGYGATGYSSGARAQINFFASETWTDSAQGTHLTLETTPTGSTTRAERFRVGPSGQWGIGGATYGSAGQYFRSGGASAAPTWATIDHGSEITGLTDDDHTNYALLAGRSSGQTLIGGTGSGNNLTLQSTSNATRGKILLGANSAYDEVNDFLGVGVTAPFQRAHFQRTDAGCGILSDHYGTTGNAFNAVRNARGTPGSPTALQSGDNLGVYFFQGRFGTTVGDNDVASGARILGVATQNWSSGNIGARLVFSTAPNSSGAAFVDAFMVSEDGGIAIVDGITAPATLTGWAKIYVDSADGDLKVKFGDGTVKTIVVDT